MSALLDDASFAADATIGGDGSLAENSINCLQRLEKSLARMPLARLTTVVPRTTSWAIEALTTEAGRIPGAPRIKMTGSLIAHVAMDESIIALVAGPNRFPRRADYLRVSEELREMVAGFDEQGFLDDPRSYHRDPAPLGEVHATSGWALGQSYRRISWDSGFEIRDGEPGGERWMDYEANRTASAWVLEHDGAPRPWLVAIHGFGTGAPVADMVTFRAHHVHHELGWNIAAIVLPVHGNRRPSRLGGEQFLGFDMVNSVHGLAQSVWDVRRLLSWVRSRDPRAIALHGVSLGGYLTALTSCFEADVDAAIAGIPVCDFPALFAEHAPTHVRARATEHGILDGNAEIAHRVVSPLEMPPLVEHGHRYLFAGLGDRMAVPSQARDLWEHWDRPEIRWFPGNHVGYLWSSKVTTFVDRVLDETWDRTDPDHPRRPLADPA